MQTSGPFNFWSLLTRRDIGSIIVVQFVVMLGFGMALPMLPLYARSFGVTVAVAGLMTSMFGLVRLAADVVAGAWVDRFGEGFTAPAGLIFYGVCTMIASLAPSYGLAVATWALGGAGSAVFFASQFSYVMRAAPQGSVARAMSVFYASFNVGLIAGGLLTGFVVRAWGIAAPLRVYGVILVVGGVIYRTIVPPAPPKHTATGASIVPETPGSRPRFGALRDLLAIRGIPVILAVQFAYMWMVVAGFDTLLPLFAHEQLGMSEAAIGVLFGVVVAAELIVLYPAGSWSDTFGRKAVLLPGFIGLTVLLGSLGFALTPVVLGFLVAGLGAASGFAGVPPAAMISDLAPPERSGLAVGAFRFVGDAAFFIAPLMVAAFADAFGFRIAFLLATIPLVAACLALARMPETGGARASGRNEQLPEVQ